MIPRIEIIQERKLVGLNLKMSLIHNRTAELWRSFILRKHEIRNAISKERISLQQYDAAYFQNFNPASEFTKWAGVEVASFDSVPEKMETLIIPAGRYAVFHYKGSSTDTSVFQYIFSVWLPGSDYALDNRPHFEVLGEKYRNADPSSEEEIWIPVKLK